MDLPELPPGVLAAREDVRHARPFRANHTLPSIIAFRQVLIPKDNA
jgi:hypothetical protein